MFAADTKDARFTSASEQSLQRAASTTAPLQPLGGGGAAVDCFRDNRLLPDVYDTGKGKIGVGAVVAHA